MVGNRNNGMALALLLIVLLALALAGHSALLLARRELQATWAFRNHVRAGDAAQIGIELAWEAPHSPPEGRPVWQGETLASGRTEDGLIYEGIRRWLSEEFFLLEGIGKTRGWVGERRVGWIGWSLAPGARVTAFLSPAQAGPARAVRTLPAFGAEELGRIPTGWDRSDCEMCRRYLDSISSGRVPSPALVWEEEEISSMVVGSTIPSLGFLTGPMLLSRSGWTRGVEEVIRTRTAGGCPGEDEPAFVGTPGDLVLGAGRLCGLLVTGGDLTIGPRCEFPGARSRGRRHDPRKTGQF